jgi:hypothetical protein
VPSARKRRVAKVAGRRRWLIAGLGAILGAVALLGGGSRAGAASLRPDGATCPRVSQAAQLPLRPGGGRLRGDVDGDGRLDRVSVHDAPTSQASCGFFLVIRTRTQVLAARVPEWYKPPQDVRIRDWSFAEPYLAAVVRLDAHRSQIVVARSHGASVAKVSLYGIVGRRLALLRFRGSYDPNELSLFGTVGAGDTNVRCLRGGPLVFLGKGPLNTAGTKWIISRSEYRLIRDQFRLRGTRTVKSSWRRVNAIARHWGMDVLPFEGCTLVRGRRL